LTTAARAGLAATACAAPRCAGDAARRAAGATAPGTRPLTSGVGTVLACATLALLLSACSGPRTRPAPPAGGPWPERDGPGTPPPNLLQVPDAEPRVEPLRVGGPNKPYEVLGRSYVPMTADAPLFERGLASWYGAKFHGKPTSTGEVYDMYAMSAAHKTMPLPSYARVRNPANGREVVVRVNDRGPFHADRVIDLSYTAAARLGLLGGVAPVEVERLTHEAIRTGAWRRPKGDTGLAVAPQPAGGGAADPIAEIARRSAAVVVPAPPSGAPGPTGAPPAPSATGFWLQLGAFREPDAADDWRRALSRQVDWLPGLASVQTDDRWHRVQAGPWSSRGEALAAADRLRELLRLAPVLIERAGP